MVDGALKLERERRRTAREEALIKLVNDPQIMGLITLMSGLYIAQRIPFSEDEGRNNALRGIATSGVALMAVSRAGLGGWPAVAAAGIAGAASEATTSNVKALFSLNPKDWAGLFS